uniref:Uncharacterized protein n=1 Tax=Kalanchoe fedtschenkoi TaxID=63787 RepID=A0A7N0VGC0_KALFE
MASFVSPSSTQLSSFSASYSSTKPHFITSKTSPTHFSSFTSKKTHHFGISATLSDNGAGSVAPASAATVSVEEPPPPVNNGALGGKTDAKAEAVAVDEGVVSGSLKFENPKWVNGTWDLSQFQKDGNTDWDAVIDAEVKRRKWLEDNPESSSNDNPVSFDTSIIPWWAWMKRFHLPEAELLNGRAAMVGFFMAYFVDSLTGVGLVDQMGNFFCKTLLFVAVAGVLVIRKNEDVEALKKLIEETTFYDKQWQATWQDETTGKSKRD